MPLAFRLDYGCVRERPTVRDGGRCQDDFTAKHKQSAEPVSLPGTIRTPYIFPRHSPGLLSRRNAVGTPSGLFFPLWPLHHRFRCRTSPVSAGESAETARHSACGAFIVGVGLLSTCRPPKLPYAYASLCGRREHRGPRRRANSSGVPGRSVLLF